MDINKLKHQLNGLNRTNWNTKDNNQKRKVLSDKYKSVGKELPKYLKEGNITENKLNKALKSLNTFYNRAINTEKNNISIGLSQPKYYKDFVNKRSEQIELIKKELSSYPKEIQQAYFDPKATIGVSRLDIQKEQMEIPSLRDIKEQAKGMGLKAKEVTKSILKDFLTLADKQQRINNLLNDIMELHGLSLDKNDMKHLDSLVKNVGYLESDILINVLNTRIEKAYYEIYKNSFNLENSDDLFNDFYTLISRYDKRTFKNIRVK